jgi:hypothetical protein
MVFNLLLTMAEFFDFGCFINAINPAIHILPIHFIRFAHSVAATRPGPVASKLSYPLFSIIDAVCLSSKEE